MHPSDTKKWYFVKNGLCQQEWPTVADTKLLFHWDLVNLSTYLPLSLQLFYTHHAAIQDGEAQ